MYIIDNMFSTQLEQYADRSQLCVVEMIKVSVFVKSGLKNSPCCSYHPFAATIRFGYSADSYSVYYFITIVWDDQDDFIPCLDQCLALLMKNPVIDGMMN